MFNLFTVTFFLAFVLQNFLHSLLIFSRLDPSSGGFLLLRFFVNVIACEYHCYVWRISNLGTSPLLVLWQLRGNQEARFPWNLLGPSAQTSSTDHLLTAARNICQLLYFIFTLVVVLLIPTRHSTTVRRSNCKHLALVKV